VQLVLESGGAYSDDKYILQSKEHLMSKIKEYRNLKRIKPYLLVIHPRSGNSAAYDRKYQLMFEGASQHLIDRAKAHHTQIKQGFNLTEPEQQPSWMTPDKQEECICYHLYNDASDIDELRNIPEG
jgi:hypothetical protein